MRIEKVFSSKGVEAWLVENHSVPLITLNLGFMGGAVQDPKDKEGLAYFTSGMLDEGAGDLNSRQFQERLEDLAARLDVEASQDVFTLSFQTLTRNKDKAFELLRLALTAPRMDPDAIERTRDQIIAALNFDMQDPEKVAARAWFKLAFGGHPYARPVKGTAESIQRIKAVDLKGFIQRHFARGNLKIAVVGDITADALKQVLDHVFGALPNEAQLQPVAEAEWPAQAERKVIEMAIPQSVANFGQQGLMRKDTDFMAAFVLNYIIGGGGFASKLMEEVREKRGLAYSVYSHLHTLQHAGIFFGGVATENKAVAESLEVIQGALARIAATGPTVEELDNAKRYLTGSYALRFDSSTKIAGQLLWIQIEDLGIDYVDKRNGLVQAVTLEDIKRAAARLLKPGSLIVTVVGKPEGLKKDEKKDAPG